MAREFDRFELQLLYNLGIGAQIRKRIIRQKKKDKSSKFSAWLSMTVTNNRDFLCTFDAEDADLTSHYTICPKHFNIVIIYDFDLSAARWLGFLDEAESSPNRIVYL